MLSQVFTGATLSGAYQTIKEAAKALKEADKIELYQKLLDIQGNMADLVAKNTAQTEEIMALKEELRIKGSLRFDEGYNCYWLYEGEKREGPYCPVCRDIEGKLVRMHLDKQQQENQQYFAGMEGVPVFRLYFCKYCVTHRSRK